MPHEWHSLGIWPIYIQWRKIRTKLLVRIKEADDHTLTIQTCTGVIREGALNRKEYRIFFSHFASITPNGAMRAKGIKTHGADGVDQFKIEIVSRL